MNPDVYVLPGDEPTLWIYPSAVHTGGDHTVTGTVTGNGEVSCTLVVALARDLTGEGTTTAVVTSGATVEGLLVGAGTVTFDLVVTPAPPPSSGAGGNRYPTRLRPHEPDWPDPEPENDREEDDVLALLLLGAL